MYSYLQVYMHVRTYVYTTCTDFDEETADDKDIDMGIYYGHSEGNVMINPLSNFDCCIS